MILKSKLKKIHLRIREMIQEFMGVSSEKVNNITTLNKAIFTSCGLNDKCHMECKADKITHDKDKKK